MLARISRNSSLQADIYGVDIIPNPVCSCGAPIKNAEHYFSNAPYIQTKETTFF